VFPLLGGPRYRSSDRRLRPQQPRLRAVRDQSESLSGFRRNQCPPSVGIAVRLPSEFAMMWASSIRVTKVEQHRPEEQTHHGQPANGRAGADRFRPTGKFGPLPPKQNGTKGEADSRRDEQECQIASKSDPHLECAPAGGQNQAAALTVCWAC